MTTGFDDYVIASATEHVIVRTKDKRVTLLVVADENMLTIELAPDDARGLADVLRNAASLAEKG